MDKRLSHSAKSIVNTSLIDFKKSLLEAICFYIFLNFLRPNFLDKINKMLWIWLTFEKVNKMSCQHHTSSLISRKL